MQDEEILGRAYDNRLMKRLLRYLRPYRWHVIFGIALSIAVSGLEAIRPWFTKQAVDVNIHNNDKEGLLLTAVAFLFQAWPIFCLLCPFVALRIHGRRPEDWNTVIMVAAPLVYAGFLVGFLYAS